MKVDTVKLAVAVGIALAGCRGDPPPSRSLEQRADELCFATRGILQLTATRIDQEAGFDRDYVGSVLAVLTPSIRFCLPGDATVATGMALATLDEQREYIRELLAAMERQP